MKKNIIEISILGDEIIYNGKKYELFKKNYKVVNDQINSTEEINRSFRNNKLPDFIRFIDGCMWDKMPETFPGSGFKVGGLVCNCKKCRIIF